jgi:hypothetical protein
LHAADSARLLTVDRLGSLTMWLIKGLYRTSETNPNALSLLHMVRWCCTALVW